MRGTRSTARRAKKSRAAGTAQLGRRLRQMSRLFGPGMTVRLPRSEIERLKQTGHIPDETKIAMDASTSSRLRHSTTSGPLRSAKTVSRIEMIAQDAAAACGSMTAVATEISVSLTSRPAQTCVL